jgi:PKD repeat protein
MRKNTTLSTLFKISMLLLFASVSKISFGQACDPKWNRLKSSNCENSPIQFEANSPGRTTFEWDYGDGQSSGSGTTSAYRDPVHAYAKAGTYTVVFKGSGGAGPCSDTVMITIKESPVVKLKALFNSSQCFAGNKFCFVDSTKAATGSKILTLKYLFSDGALYTLNDPKGGDTICHTVIDPNGGYFDLTIEAEDYNGCVTKIKYDKFIRVFPKIGVNFKSNAPNACIKSLATITNLTDTFTKLNDIARFVWNFGDPKDPQNVISGDSITNTQWWKGPTGNGVIYHTYDVSGRKSGTYVFNGSLTVTTKYGCTETFTFKGSATISILNVRIIAEDDSACSSDPEVKFTAVDAGSGDPITGVGSFLWNFGDPPSGPANTDKTTLIKAPHNYGLGPWMTSLNIKAGPCNITVFDTITKVGPTSAIERPFTRVPEDEKYQCIITDSVHFTNVSTFYHTDPNPVFEDSSAVYRYYTLFSSRKVPYYELPLTEDTLGPYATYRGVATTITRFYLENDTLETFPQSALTADSIIFYVNGKKEKRAVSNPIISGQDTLVIKKLKEYAFKWPGDQTAINSVFPPPTQRHKDHVLRLWTFGDNYAPKCTTDTKETKTLV